MPNLPVNESFGAPAPDYPDETWSTGKWNTGPGTTGEAGNFIDIYGVNKTNIVPLPVNPHADGWETPVFNKPQYYKGGTTIEGAGIQFKSHKLQFYRGKALQLPE